MQTLGSLLRLAIMLLVLVAAPLAAVLGKPSLRRKTVELVDRAIAGVSASAAQDSGDASDPIPPFGGDPVESSAPQIIVSDPVLPRSRLGAPEGARGGTVQRSAAASGDLPPPQGIASQIPDPSEYESGSGTEPAPPSSATVPSANLVALTPQGAAPQIDDLLLRLQRQGASYYRLEEWAGPPRKYRFVCRYREGGGEQVIESVQPDQLAAVSDVVRRFESRHRVAALPTE